MIALAIDIALSKRLKTQRILPTPPNKISLVQELDA